MNRAPRTPLAKWPTVADRVQVARLLLAGGMRQREAAEEAGIDRATLQRALETPEKREARLAKRRAKWAASHPQGRESNRRKYWSRRASKAELEYADIVAELVNERVRLRNALRNAQTRVSKLKSDLQRERQSNG